jgi:hypothetical protein
MWEDDFEFLSRPVHTFERANHDPLQDIYENGLGVLAKTAL